MRSARGVSSLPCCSAASAVLAFLAALGMHALLYFNWLTRQWERVRLLLVALSHRRLVAGIHGSLHVPPWLLPRALLLRDLDQAAAAVREACGRPVRHYRAPFGLLFRPQAAWVRARGVTPVLGDVYPRDWSLRESATIARRVIERLAPGSIVILHDSSALADPDRGPTVGAVDAILAEA